jgi:hypothetical protein
LDDELEVWRREWQAQPAVTMDLIRDLIRKVERDTVRMRRSRWALLAPTTVAAGTTVIAALNPRIDAIVFAGGMWVLVILTWLALAQGLKGVWTPAEQTTAAYLDLAVERARRAIKSFRSGRLLSPLITAFVLTGVWQGMKSQGRLESASGYWSLAAVSLYTIGIVAFVMFLNHKKQKKRQAELEYLLDLRRRFKEGGR